MRRFVVTALMVAAILIQLVLFLSESSVGSAQGPDNIGSTPSPLAGKWTYRSFRSDPSLSADISSLLFGQGTMDLVAPAPDRFQGMLGGEGWQLDLAGSVKTGDPTAIRFQGKGRIGGEEWVYDYLGYLVPAWPNGVDQRAAIVGTIVRTAPHSKGKAPAGYVAQWIAVKQDAAAGASSLAPAKRGGVEGVLRDREIAWAKAVGTNDPANWRLLSREVSVRRGWGNSPRSRAAPGRFPQRQAQDRIGDRPGGHRAGLRGLRRHQHPQCG